MNTAPDRWSSLTAFFSDTVVQAVLGVLAVLIVTGIAIYVLSRFRDSTIKDSQASDLLEKNFEEMRSEGDIDVQEFRKIKALLAGAPTGSPRASSTSPSAIDGVKSKNDADSKDRV